MLPFVLAHPSRSAQAAMPSSAIEPLERVVRAFLRERGLNFWVSGDETTLPGPTGCWESIHYQTPVQTQIQLNPPSFTPDSNDDQKLEHSNNDDTSSPD